MCAFTACWIAGITAFPSFAWITNAWYCPEVIASWICETWVCALKFGSKNLALTPACFAACFTPAQVACANEFAAAKPKKATALTLPCLVAAWFGFALAPTLETTARSATAAPASSSAAPADGRWFSYFSLLPPLVGS